MADRNLEILNGSDVLEFYSLERFWLSSMTCFCLTQLEVKKTLECAELKSKPAAKYVEEQPYVSNHYVLYYLNATFYIICQHRFQEDHARRDATRGVLTGNKKLLEKNRNTTLRHHGDVF